MEFIVAGTLAFSVTPTFAAAAAYAEEQSRTASKPQGMSYKEAKVLVKALGAGGFLVGENVAIELDIQRTRHYA